MYKGRLLLRLIHLYGNTTLQTCKFCPVRRPVEHGNVPISRLPHRIGDYSLYYQKGEIDILNCVYPHPRFPRLDTFCTPSFYFCPAITHRFNIEGKHANLQLHDRFGRLKIAPLNGLLLLEIITQLIKREQVEVSSV